MQTRRMEKENRASYRRNDQYVLNSQFTKSESNSEYNHLDSSKMNGFYFNQSSQNNYSQNANQETQRFAFENNTQNPTQQNFNITRLNERIEFNCFNERDQSPAIEEPSPKRNLSKFKERVLKENTDFNNSPTFREPTNPDNYTEEDNPYYGDNMRSNDQNLGIYAYQHQDDSKRGLMKYRNLRLNNLQGLIAQGRCSTKREGIQR